MRVVPTEALVVLVLAICEVDGLRQGPRRLVVRRRARPDSTKLLFNDWEHFWWWAIQGAFFPRPIITPDFPTSATTANPSAGFRDTRRNRKTLAKPPPPTSAKPAPRKKTYSSCPPALLLLGGDDHKRLCPCQRARGHVEERAGHDTLRLVLAHVLLGGISHPGPDFKCFSKFSNVLRMAVLRRFTKARKTLSGG